MQTGYWPLFRYNPDLIHKGKNPLQLDSRPPSLPIEKYMYNETRFTILKNSDPKTAQELLRLAQEDVDNRWSMYANLASAPVPEDTKAAEPAHATQEGKQ